MKGVEHIKNGVSNENIEYINTMKKDDGTEEYHFSVDIPKVDENGYPCDEWYCVDYFRTKGEALKYAIDKFGADKNGNVNLVSSF